MIPGVIKGQPVWVYEILGSRIPHKLKQMTANHYCFTLNNPTKTPEEFLEKLGARTIVRYCIFQLEAGENETPHWQGYIELKRSQRLSWLKNNISATAHFERRAGTRDEARDYCRKEDTRQSGPWEYGTWKAGGQGRRTDITAFKDAILNGKRKRDLLDEGYDKEMCKYPKFYDTVRGLYRPRRESNSFTGVVLLYGYPGTGKTRYVKENYPEHWEAAIGNGTNWYDGYDLHNVVLFDDFAGRMSKVPLDTTLKLFDRYVRMVPVKGGFTWWKPNLLFITTNIHPADWYDWTERRAQWPALTRRINHVYWYKRDGEVISMTDEEERDNFFENSHLFMED